MSAAGGADGQLAGTIDQIELVWRSCAEHWRDQARRDFEDGHLRPLIDAARMGAAAIGELGEMLRRARTECA